MKRHPSAPDRTRRRLLTTAAGFAASAVWAGFANAQQPRPGQQRPANPPGRSTAPPPPPVTSLPNGFPWIETQAGFAYVMDAGTGAVLLDKNASQRMFPSSMTKLMTVYLVFEKLAKGELRMEDTLLVSENAWRKGGSKMYVEVNTRVRIDDLLRGAIVSSGNDACIVLAEGLAGSEEKFAEQMTAKAAAIGMTDTNYKNSSGWPADDHYSTCRDLATLSRRTIEDFPQYYPIYAEREFRYGGISQPNRNTLLSRSSGTDGLKTGHTEAAGFGIAVSVLRQGRRIVMVLNGMASMRQRAIEAERITDWAYREFENYTLVKAGEEIEKADVWLGVEKQVALTTAAPLIVTLPRRFRKDMKVTLSYDGPIPAPIVKGAPLAKLVVTAPSVDPIQLPLIAGADVAQLSGVGRIREVAMLKIFGKR